MISSFKRDEELLVEYLWNTGLQGDSDLVRIPQWVRTSELTLPSPAAIRCQRSFSQYGQPYCRLNFLVSICNTDVREK